MAPPQGLLEFGNIKGVLYGSVSVGHGITPSTCSLYAVPQSPPYSRQSTLIFRYGGGRIVLPDCLLDAVEFQLREDGQTIMILLILDRRWKWRFGRVLS